jgi:hypothetical protein
MIFGQSGNKVLRYFCQANYTQSDCGYEKVEYILEKKVRLRIVSSFSQPI